DDDAIDILLLKQLEMVLVDAPFRLAPVGRGFGTDPVTVGNRHDLAGGRQLIDQHPAAVADANDAYPDAIVSSKRLAPYGIRSGNSCRLQNLSSSHGHFRDHYGIAAAPRPEAAR